MQELPPTRRSQASQGGCQRGALSIVPLVSLHGSRQQQGNRKVGSAGEQADMASPPPNHPTGHFPQKEATSSGSKGGRAGEQVVPGRPRQVPVGGGGGRAIAPLVTHRLALITGQA